MLTRQGSYDQSAQQELLNSVPGLNSPSQQAGDFTVNAGSVGLFLINKGSAAAITLAAPRAGTDDFKQIQFISTTAFAHVITATGLLKNGTTNANVATTSAFAGSGLTLMAFNGLWYLVAQNVVTFT